MHTSDFHYDLPKELIAQTPIEPRDHSRLLVYHRESAVVEHQHFFDLPNHLRAGDALVINETRVIPARLLGEREHTGGAVELLLLKRLDKDRWECLVKPGRKMQEGQVAIFGGGALRATVMSRTQAGGRVVSFAHEGTFEQVLDALGHMPLPPYITQHLADKERYQTVYAKQEGSAAAPTAGLHFTPELLARIEGMGVKVVPVLLHVGLGTFRPVKAGSIEEHIMHEEHYEISPQAAQTLKQTRAAGGRIICVGTTSARALESAVDAQGAICAGAGETSIFITPGYSLRATDALITNFHLPESTLLMLVAALVGREEMLGLYELAVAQSYRFFSFGDAMLIL